MSKIIKAAARFTRALFFNSKNPHVIGRIAEHLDNEYLRRLSAPDVAVEELMDIAMADEHFRSALPQNDGTGLVRLAVVGNALVANIYQLHEFPGGMLQHPYNDDWRRDGIIDYLITSEAERDNRGKLVKINHVLEPITRPYLTTYSYDYDEPLASYRLPLMKEELVRIDRISMPTHRRKAA